MKSKNVLDWPTIELDEIALVQTGIAVNGDAVKDEPISVPYLRVANVQDGHVDLSKIKNITISSRQLARYSLQVGDVLMTEGGDFDKLGRGTVWRGQIAPCIHQNHVFAVRPNQDRILSEFLAAFCESTLGKRYFLICSKQTTNLASINSTQLKAMPITLPSLIEQQRIVTVLDAWNQATEKTERLIKTKIELRQWYRMNLLNGDKRLSKFKLSWKTTPLSSVLTEHGCYSTGKEPVFSVSVHRGLVNQIEHLGRSFSAANTGNYNRVLPGDIVYTKSPTGEFPLGVIKQSKIEEDVIVSPLYGVFSPTSRSLGTIIDAVFESPIATQNYLTPLVQKGAKNTIAITNRRFLEGELHLPTDRAEQDAIAALLDASRSEIVALESSLECLRTQKRGLMQKLLTGEWELDARFDLSAVATKGIA